MKQIRGILFLLFGICIFTALFEPKFLSSTNLENLVMRTSFVAIMGIGVALVIITGGIDLSIGSIVALVRCVLPIMLTIQWTSPGEMDVSSVTMASKRVEFYDEGHTFKPGDYALFSEGFAIKKAAIWKIENTTADSVILSASPSGNDEQGTLTPAYPVGEVRHAESVIVVDGDFSWLGNEDQIAFFKEGSWARNDLILTGTELNGGQTLLHLRTPPDAGLTAGVFIPVQGKHMNTWLAIGIILVMCALIGLYHGYLITRLDLPPFIVTLCSLLIFRGLARFITEDKTRGFGDYFSNLKFLANGDIFSVPVPFLDRIARGKFGSADVDTGEFIEAVTWVGVPVPFAIALVIAIAAIIFLNYSIYGRYLLALGNNEKAARFSGVNTRRMTVSAYVVCSFMAGVGGILYVLYLNTTQPATTGTFYELYAIAAAVLGGCSLRGGEGSIIGVCIGAAVMQVLYNAINLLGIKTQLEWTVIGLVLLGGVIADEIFKRMAAKRRAKDSAG